MKRDVGRYVSEESTITELYNRKSLATPDCFAPYLVNVTTKEYCSHGSICLETTFISEEFGMKMRLLKNSEAGHTVRAPFQKLHFRVMLAYPKIGPRYAIKRHDRAMEQQFILFILFLKA